MIKNVKKKYKISFAGDTSLGDWYLKTMGYKNHLKRLEQDPLSFFESVKAIFDNSDHFIINLETVLANDPKPILKGKKYLNYDQPKRTLTTLKSLGVTATGLANNHSMDFGYRVLRSTRQLLRKYKIKTFGIGRNKRKASKPLKLTLEGNKSNLNIYIIAGMRAGKRYYRYNFFANRLRGGMNSVPLNTMSSQIAKLRKNDPTSIIIIYPHWQGHDYKWASEHDTIKKRCRSFIDAGANYIYGHGPHILNDIEKYNDGIIAYSIGNFVFNSPGRYKKMQAPPYSLIVNMLIEENENGTWCINNKFYPIVTDNKRTKFKTRQINEKEINALTSSYNKDELGFYIDSLNCNHLREVKKL